eukprot:TRINITY_DN13695_c0_g1_i2.p1 TRINITY_DN13695_c0_g1~~TRINITY_DN13695_c0_g1_i2.p1  ORF type:complete len:235 (+),score=56.63 TRINITY_DN13695_c0_g1_i2:687-1391(+)
MVDYGSYMVQRHQPIARRVLRAEAVDELRGDLKKEQLRKSLDKYDDYISKRNTISSTINSKNKQIQPIAIKHTHKEEEKAVTSGEISEVKKELGKLYKDFANCKTILDNSLTEVKAIMNKLGAKEVALHEDHKVHETEEIQPSAEQEKIMRNEEAKNPVKEEANAQHFGFNRADEITEVKTSEANLIPASKRITNDELPLKEEEDVSLVRTDNFIFEKYKKIEQVKDLLKTLKS